MDDHGDSVGEATDLVVPLGSEGPAIAGVLDGAEGDVDAFRFEADAGDRVALTITPDAGADTLLQGATIDLVGPDGTSEQVASYRNADVDADQPEEIDFVVQRSGTQALLLGTFTLGDNPLFGFPPTEGGYLISAMRTAGTADDHGDAQETATSLTAGQATEGRIETLGDVDVFEIDFGSDGVLETVLEVEWQASAGPGLLREARITLQVDNADLGASATALSAFTETLVPSSDAPIYVTVGADQALGGYTLTARPAEPEPDPTDDVQTIDGNVGDSRVSTGSNDDVVTAKGGRDVVKTFAGNDAIDLGSGDDVVLSGSGDDTVTGGKGNDVIKTAAGADEVDAGDGDDVVLTGDGDDRVFGGAGDDTLKPGRGNDLMFGEDGDDILVGFRSDELLDGGQGDDTLLGNLGNDELEGGPGNDRLQGGPGRDAFVYRDSNFGHDRIVIDFRIGSDIIDFREAADITGLEDLRITTAGDNTRIEVIGADASIIVGGVDLTDHEDEAFVF